MIIDTRTDTKPRTRTNLFAERPDDGLIRLKDLLPVIGVSASTLWRRVNAGAFPKPAKLGERITVWQVGAIRQWLKAQGTAQAPQ